MLHIYEAIARKLKVNVVGYDYTGYGASIQFGVSPTEKQIYMDIDTVYDYVLSCGLVSDAGREIVVYGQSGMSCYIRSCVADCYLLYVLLVGSGPSCYIASTRPVAGLILHSPILSGLRVLTPSRTLACFDIFPNISRITRVTSPVFIIHGMADREVPFHHGRDLHAAVRADCQSEPWWVPDKGHNDVIMGNEREYLHRLSIFVESLDSRRERRLQVEQEKIRSAGDDFMPVVTIER
jgi:hypothetical protein